MIKNLNIYLFKDESENSEREMDTSKTETSEILAPQVNTLWHLLIYFFFYAED